MSSAVVALLGRDAEIEVVRRFLEEAAVDGRCLLLTGSAGIGRTAVLDAAATMASAAGAWVARAQGVEDEADLPFAGLSRLLASAEEVVERLHPLHRTVLRAALGQDGRAVDDAAVAAALVAALETAAGARPAVVAVDDLPAMDAPSERCLRSLARQLPGHRIGLLATATTADADDGFTECRLTPLDEDAAVALLAIRSPRLARADRDRVVREAEGNPLALWELPLRTGQAPGPRLVSLFGEQVADLPTSARRLLLLAALADTGDLDVLLGADVPAPEELGRAERAGLVRIAGRRVVFAHPAVRATVTAAATVEERRQAHAVLAARADRRDRRLRHLSEATVGTDEEIARELEELAQRLLEHGDPAGAIAALRRCTGLTPPGAARTRRAARAAYVDASIGGNLDGGAALPGPGAGGSIWAAAARGHVLAHGDGDLDAAHRLVVGALEAVGPEVEPAALVAALDTLLMICRFADRAELWSPLRALAARHADCIPAELALSVRSAGRLRPVPPDRLDPATVVRAGWSLLAVDDLELCTPELRRVLDDGRQGGAAGSAISAAVLLMLDAVAAGRWDDASVLAQEGQDLGALHGHETLAMLAGAGPAWVAACRGDEVACQDHTGRMIGWAAPRGAKLVHHHAVHARVLAALGRGDAETAYHQACTVSRPGLVEPDGHGHRLIMDLVEAAVRTGRQAEAVAHVRAAQDAGLADLSARSALLLAGATALTEQGDEARARYEQALAVPGAEGWPFDAARVRLAYGEHLRRSRATLAARLQLTTSLATFRRLGADPWTARAESELRAAGPRAPRARDAVATVLSHQERTVARLAATGATNRQIAERLGLSPRTVGSHLTRVFQKLGVTSRAALGQALRASDAAGNPD